MESSGVPLYLGPYIYCFSLLYLKVIFRSLCAEANQPQVTAAIAFGYRR